MHDIVIANVINGTKAIITGNINTNKILRSGLRFFIVVGFKV